jgi:hypothetical protein
MHKEVSRNEKYVELFTDMPQATETRLFNNGIKWKTTGDKEWRDGANGGWKDPTGFLM